MSISFTYNVLNQLEDLYLNLLTTKGSKDSLLITFKIQWFSGSLFLFNLSALLWFGLVEAGLYVRLWRCQLSIPCLVAQDHTGQTHVVFGDSREVDEGEGGVVLALLDNNFDLEVLIIKEILRDHGLEFGSQRGPQFCSQGFQFLGFAFLLFLDHFDALFDVGTENIHGHKHGASETGVTVSVILVGNKNMELVDFEIPADLSDADPIYQSHCRNRRDLLWFFWFWLSLPRFQDCDIGLDRGDEGVPNITKEIGNL